MPKLSREAAYSHFALAIRIASIHDRYVGSEVNCSFSHRNDGVNPSFGQTANGLYLSCHYGDPRHLWTPWGAWHFATTFMRGDLDVQGFLAHFQTDDGTEMISYDDGVTPFYIYALYALDGELLPVPALALPNEYLPHEEARNSWGQLSAEYPSNPLP